ncbi:hypothetical protein WEI85_12810 [Actinomycetes bacterium KLBMP 9797]
MRIVRPLFRTVAAVVLGLAMVVPGATVVPRATPPAWAQEGDQTDWMQFVEVLKKIWEAGSDGRLDPAEIADFVMLIEQALTGVKTDVLAALDSKVSAQIRGKIDSAINAVYNLDAPPWLRGPAIDTIQNGAYEARAQLGAAWDDHNRDVFGKAMITLFTALDGAFTRIDADNAAQGRPSNMAGNNKRQFRQGLEDLMRTMQPRCTYNPLPEKNGYVTYDCTYNGRTVHAQANPLGGEWSIDGGPWQQLNRGQLEGLVFDTVMHDTAWPIAKKAHEELLRQGVQLP